jgi:hypothetical protein
MHCASRNFFQLERKSWQEQASTILFPPVSLQAKHHHLTGSTCFEERFVQATMHGGNRFAPYVRSL